MGLLLVGYMREILRGLKSSVLPSITIKNVNPLVIQG